MLSIEYTVRYVAAMIVLLSILYHICEREPRVHPNYGTVAAGGMTAAGRSVLIVYPGKITWYAII